MELGVLPASPGILVYMFENCFSAAAVVTSAEHSYWWNRLVFVRKTRAKFDRKGVLIMPNWNTLFFGLLSGLATALAAYLTVRIAHLKFRGK